MIENNNQLSVTFHRIDEFKRALKETENEKILVQLQIDAIQSTIAVLQSQADQFMGMSISPK